jgi:hypothetical protein
MSALFVFIALVGIALLSGLGRRGDAARGVGAEFVVGGIIVGPALLGLVERVTLDGFQPLIVMSIGWLAAATGVQHGLYRTKFAGLSGYISGVLLGSVFVAGFGLVAAEFVRTSSELSAIGPHSRWTFAGMAGAALGMSAEYRGELGAGEPSQGGRLRAGVSSGAVVPALISLCAIAGFDPPKLHVPWAYWVWSLSGPTLGAVFGGTVASLLGRKFRFGEFWPVAIGAVLLVAGLAARFQLSLVATSFALGVCLVVLSPHREVIRELIARATVPIQLPFAVLAGALVTWPRSTSLWILVGELVLLRTVIQFGAAFLVARLNGMRGAREFGLSLLPVGQLGLAVAILALFRLPEPLGKVVLMSVCLSAILGQLLGGPALERLSLGSTGPETNASAPALDGGQV